MFNRSLGALLSVAMSFAASIAGAQEPIKVGMILEMSGPFADLGRQILAGAQAYMKAHGETVAGRKVELIVKDTTGASPDIAKRLAQELVTNDNVDFLAGFGLTPNALAVAPLATEARKPMIIMNAATSIITTRSPYIVRVSMTLPQVTAPLASWAIKNGIKSVYTLVSDYGPGIDAETTFKKTFTEAGGKIVGSVRVPLRNPEFAPFLQRIKDAHPQAVFIFLPGSSEQPVAFMKGFAERELNKAGIRLIATGDVTEDGVLEAMGDTPLGVVTSHHYSAAHESAQNRAFLKSYADSTGPGTRPNFMAVGGWDGMAAIYEVIRKLNGQIDGDKAMEVLKGLRLDSPRGPLVIDPETRDPIQTVYIRRVQKINGKPYNVEFEQIPEVKDPGK
ncbi:MAG TPA: ABC transporter substrate-binding protein [Burkholderiales bacterium]|nr:ABC transporter substrate-binding protein [Burkholderiales bacterium]